MRAQARRIVLQNREALLLDFGPIRYFPNVGKWRIGHSFGWLSSEKGMKERNPSAREGLTPSGMSAGRRHSEAQGSVSPSAEGDLRLRLKKPQTFEKV